MSPWLAPKATAERLGIVGLAVERAERVYYQVAVALARCSEPREAERALANARAVVDARLEHIRDPRLRTLYVESKWVKSIRRDLPIA